MPLNATPISLPVRISEKDGKPCIDLRRVTTDTELLSFILKAAFNNQPVVFLPEFRDRMQSISSAIEKGLIARGDDGGYYLLI